MDLPLEGKQILLEILEHVSHPSAFASELKDLGVKIVLPHPSLVETFRAAGLEAVSPSEDADVTIVANLEDAKRFSKAGRRFAFTVEIKGARDVDLAAEAAKEGAKYVIVKTGDWKIIPLENLIARLQASATKLYAYVSGFEEVDMMLSILERGVDGVVLRGTSIEDVKKALHLLSAAEGVTLKNVKITEVKDIGTGDRACVDTASILTLGEGMLIGSRANFLFLVHNESIGSEFTSPRPFRVNAGSIQSYILTPSGKTRYLSELETGDEVMVVRKDGRKRSVIVGRVKIERRPLKLVKAEVAGQVGAVLVQNAETIRFVGSDGRIIAVTTLSPGDEILAYVEEKGGRHFGMAVDEFMLEK